MFYHVTKEEKLPRVLYQKERNKNEKWREILVDLDSYGSLEAVIAAIIDLENGCKVFLHVEGAKSLTRTESVIFSRYLSAFLGKGGVLVLYSTPKCALAKELKIGAMKHDGGV